MKSAFATVFLLAQAAVCGAQNLPVKGSVLADTLRLKESAVSARVEPVKVVGDTLVYNAAAFNIAEDAALEDLLKRIPGLEITDGGTVTIGGRQVKKLLVNGREYFGGDVRDGIKTLPADMVANVRNYDRPTDFARISGIEDGESEPVLDVTVKKHLVGKWRSRLSAGGGTESRYSGRAGADLIDKNNQNSLVVRANNTAGKASFSTTDRNSVGTGASGDRHSRGAGYSFSRTRKGFKSEGSFKYDGSLRDATGNSTSQNFTSTGYDYTLSERSADDGADNVKGSVKMEWNPSKQWTVLAEPTLNLKLSSSVSSSESSNYYSDLERLKTTTSNGQALYDFRLNPRIVLQVTRRSPTKRGRSVTLRLDPQASVQSTDTYVDVLTRYVSSAKPDAARKLFIAGADSYCYMSGSLSYSEPIAGKWHLQSILSGQRRWSTSGRDYYLLGDAFWCVAPTNSRSRQLLALPDGYESSRSDEYSSDGECRYSNLNLTESIRYIRRKFSVTAGAALRLQWTDLVYSTAEQPSGTASAFAWGLAPNIALKYNPDKLTRLSFTWRSWGGVPSVRDLLPVKTGTNPLYVRQGNPSLKPTLTHNAEAVWISSDPVGHSSVNVTLNARYYVDGVCSSSVYDETTGGRTTMPVNLSGSWRAGADAVYTKTFRDNRFSLSSHVAASYNNTVSLIYNSATRGNDLNAVRRLMVREKTSGKFRTHRFELTADIGADYTAESSILRPGMTETPMSLHTGIGTIVRLPAKLRLEADWQMVMQRGYAIERFNRNFHYLNASLSRTVLRGNGTVRLEANDILGSGLNLTRTFSTTSRNVTTWNGVTRYALLSFTYRFPGSK